MAMSNYLMRALQALQAMYGGGVSNSPFSVGPSNDRMARFPQFIGAPAAAENQFYGAPAPVSQGAFSQYTGAPAFTTMGNFAQGSMGSMGGDTNAYNTLYSNLLQKLGNTQFGTGTYSLPSGVSALRR